MQLLCRPCCDSAYRIRDLACTEGDKLKEQSDIAVARCLLSST